jgi:putative membrane protein
MTTPSFAAFAATSDDKTLSEADKMFVAKVSQGGMFEVEASKVANEKASEQDVIDTSVTEVHDHQLVGDKLKTIAGTLGLPFPSELNAEFQARLAKLKALSGKAFDVAYIKEMDAIHDVDVAAFGEESKSGANPALKAFAAETVLIVRRHIGSLHAVPLPTT